MTALLNTVLAAAQKRRAYLETAYELENLPLDVALDLNIYAGDAHKIAREAVYGA